MTTVALVCLGVVSCSLLLSVLRLFLGPTAPDRTLAMDSVWINVVGIFVLVSLVNQTSALFDAVVVVSLLGFLGTACLSFFLDRGDIFD